MDEGSPKQMVDLYKQLLVGQNPVKQNESDSAVGVAEDSEGLGRFPGKSPICWNMENRIAEITDFRVIDIDKGRCSNVKREAASFSMKVGLMKLGADHGIHLKIFRVRKSQVPIPPCMKNTDRTLGKGDMYCNIYKTHEPSGR